MPVSADPVFAARLHAHGQPLAIEPVDLAAPGPDEVRVALEYAGVNPVDRYVAEGRVAPDGPLPRTLGGEAAGLLDGRPVLVAGAGLGTVRDGLWAREAVVPRAAVVELPDGVATREAAAMGVAGLTAWNVVHDLAGTTAEDRVLVLGAAGGVGSMIVSLAQALGATVWGQTGSEDKAEVITGQGANRAIVAGAEHLHEVIAELAPTAVFDPLGGPFLAPIVEALAPRGRIVSFGTSAGADVAFNLQSLYRKSGALLGYGGMQLDQDSRRRGLRRALGALADGSLTVVIDDAMPLREVGEAFARLTRRAVRGKLLLDLHSGSSAPRGPRRAA
jgi:NADPH2:quinone reductase